MSFQRIRDRLTTKTGLDPDTLSRTAVAGEVQRRMRAQATSSLEAYADLIERDAAEFDRLVTALLVHETSFFRYPASFRLLADEVRRHVAQGGALPFRAHSVACATGEEPASVAITLLDAGLEPAQFEVDATDLSRVALAQARSGQYRRRVMRAVPDGLRARHFRPAGELWQLRESIRSRIRYAEGNVVDPAFGLASRTRYDVVFCRNLLIYLVPEARAELLRRLLAMLRPGGLLFVGHAEVAAVRAVGLALAQPVDAFACRHAPTPEGPGGRAPTPRAEARRPPPLQPAARAREPAVPAADLASAQRLADAGDLLEARRVLDAALAEGAATAEHYHLLAVIESALSREDASEQALIRALYLDPEHYASLVQLALLAEQRGDRARAARLRAKAERVRKAEVGHGDA